MAEIHQILDGMNELSERVQNLEAGATEAEGQAQATQQELARSQAGVKRKGEERSSSATTGGRDRRVCVEASASASQRIGFTAVR